MQPPSVTIDDALRELIEAVRNMSRNGSAGSQERLIQALVEGRRALEAPVLRVQLLTDYAQLPTRAHDDDAGIDLYASEDCRIMPGHFKDIPTGVAVETPPGWWCRIVGRSSTLRRKQLLVAEGTIDEGFRGELFSGAWNMAEHPRYVERGERVAQLILCRTPPAGLRIESAHQLSISDRGTNGFGSTGD